MKKKKYNVLDLFAGCGGLSNGFEKTGKFNIISANEFWDPASDTYEKNHPNTKMIRGDVTDNEIKKQIYKTFGGVGCDVIIGGPPCQAYSNAGFRDPDDPRGILFKDYVEIVNHLKPKLFVMENVKGLLTIKHEKDNLTGKDKKELDNLRKLEKEKQDLLLLRKRFKNSPDNFKFDKKDEERIDKLSEEIAEHKKLHPYLHENVTDQIVRSFDEIGYKVKFKLLNAANYGVPQRRERVIFIGVKEDLNVRHPEPTHLKNGDDLLGNKKWKTVREAIDDLKNQEENIEWNHILTKHSNDFVKKLENTPVGKSAFGFSDAFHRNDPDMPSRTVKENHGGVLVHYEKNRVMTPRELARLQSFSDDFIFEGSKSQILVQIGNAVPPLLGKAIGETVAEILDEKY
jgi:site-specific DNA-cytosine methylase